MKVNNVKIINMCEVAVETKGKVINCGSVDCDDCPFGRIDCTNEAKVLKIAREVLGGK